MSMENQVQKLSEAVEALANTQARARLEQLFDAGTWMELDRLACAEVVTGFGMVDGCPVYAFAQDRSVNCGAVGLEQGKKLRRVYELAAQNGAPLVGVYDSDGARLGEGLDAMDAIADILLLSNTLSGVVPQIAVVAGACVGSAALIASNADLVIAVQDADYYLNPGDDSATASLTVADVDAALERVRTLLSLLPANNLSAAAAYEAEEAAGAAVASADMADVANTLADAASVVELDGTTVCRVALARMGGFPCGVVTLAGDAIPCKDSAVVARFVRLCDAFSLPVITFVDAAGFQSLKGAARLAHTYAEATTAKITVITGRAIGAVYIAAAGKAAGADVVLAWPTAVISPLAPEAAMHILWKERLAAMTDPTTERQQLADEYAQTVCSPVAAAQGGYVTDVVTPEQTKGRLTALLDMLAGKRVSRLPKKHSNMPL